MPRITKHNALSFFNDINFVIIKDSLYTHLIGICNIVQYNFILHCSYKEYHIIGYFEKKKNLRQDYFLGHIGFVLPKIKTEV